MRPLLPALLCCIGFAFATNIGVHMGWEIVKVNAPAGAHLPPAFTIDAVFYIFAFAKPAMAWIVEGRKAMDAEAASAAALLQAIPQPPPTNATGGLVDAYSEAFRLQSWLAAGGEDNRVVYVRRRAEGGCDGFQMLAFADESRVPGPAEPAWLAFASIPGDVCAARSAAPATPAPAQ